MRSRVSILLPAAIGIIATAAQPARATFHFTQIEQVIGGVNGDPTAQAIQLRMRGLSQNLLSPARIRAWDANGLNPVVVVDFASSVPNHGAGVRVLIASANFANVTNPTAVPDFVMANLIPASYLAAGSLTFETDTGTIIYWRLSWGGANYAGPTTGSITNDLDGEFGPPWPGPLPSADLQALLFQGAAGARSIANDTDYALTGSAAIFNNNAANSFTLVGDCPFIDDFERAAGTTVGNGWVEVGGNPGAIAIEFDGVDTYCLLSRDGVSITQSSIDTSGLTNVTFDYDWRDNGATDAGDSLIVQWKPTADASFITLATHVLTQTAFLSESHALPASAENTSIDIRFLTSVASNMKGAHVDNVGVCRCPDGDGDGSCDADDGCPADPNKTAPGVCGCGTPDTDTDGDATLDCLDACPDEPALVNPDEPGTELTCNDTIDNDCDGSTDGADSDCGPVCVCGDFNAGAPDGSVNLLDFAQFSLCFGGLATTPGCECTDLNQDGTINLFDFATFGLIFGAPAANTPPNCT